MEVFDLSVLLLGILPRFRLSDIQRDRLWHRICVGLDPPDEKKQPRNMSITKKEVKHDGTERKNV